jgi:hypothetical protein
MPKLNSFQLQIKTGKRPGPSQPKYNINGFPLDFDVCDGGTGSGETLNATGSPQSFPHSLTLGGPEQGSPPWDIDSIVATYHCANDNPYTIRLGAVTLDDQSDLNIWHERPAPTFDV